MLIKLISFILSATYLLLSKGCVLMVICFILIILLFIVFCIIVKGGKLLVTGEYTITLVNNQVIVSMTDFYKTKHLKNKRVNILRRNTYQC